MRRNGYQPTSNNLGDTPPNANSNVHTPYGDKKTKFFVRDISKIDELEAEVNNYTNDIDLIRVEFAATKNKIIAMVMYYEHI